MKYFRLILFVILLCGVCYAQEKKPNFILFDDGCGDPAMESQLYGFWKGKIVKIKSANQIVLGLIGHTLTIKLVGINPNENKEKIINFLKKNLIGKEVWVTANRRKKSDKEFGAIVQVLDSDIENISQYLIEKGIAKYKDFESDNLIPYYVPCRLQKAEERAKQAKLGIWAN